MPTPVESAELLLRLYELRREPVMRAAREWFLRAFHPESLDDVVAAVLGEDNPKYRMVLGYWDMACSFVTHEAIDAEMFRDASAEIIATFSKMAPFVEAMRVRTGNPDYLRHIERVVQGYPDVDARMATLRQQLREAGARDAERRAAAARTAAAAQPHDADRDARG